MLVKSRIYMTIVVAFIILLYSLFNSFQGVLSAQNLITYIEKSELKLNVYALELEDVVKSSEIQILQALIRKDLNISEIKMSSSKSIDAIVMHMGHLVENPEVEQIVHTLQKRSISFILVEKSLMNAIQSKDKEDISDALIGYNTTAEAFLKDSKKLVNLSNILLHKRVEELKKSNSTNRRSVVFAAIFAGLLIFFTLYKLINLHERVKRELERAEEAENRAKELQKELQTYSQELENQVEQKTEELYAKIYTQQLSGYANRHKLLDDFAQEHFSAIVIMNIDKFQRFNDVYGEKKGNMALILSAKYLSEEFSDEGVQFYHINGDEFVYAIRESANISDAYIIEKMKELLNKFSQYRFVNKEDEFSFNLSAGIAFGDGEDTLAYADMALKEAKKANIAMRIFNDTKDIAISHKEDLECSKLLNKAIETDNILSFVQPIIPLQDESLPTKYESLVRLRDENGSIIPPFRFIDVAKANRIYYKITNAVMRNTLETIKKYSVPISLNFSLRDITNERTMKLFFEQLEIFNTPELLTIELLETEEIQEYQVVYDFCIKVRKYGVSIAIDDFGSGYANFTHLLKLPIDFIKIDATLISNIDRDYNSRLMVETIVDLAKKLKVKTIAEFVSSKEIYETVKSLNVDYAQGYYRGKPEAIEKYMQS